ncbi:MAG: O-antigen ligase family protein [Deltaproteobacteria bacterium]|nr:O-antigen ligase family protein [Deltaproteobacteria bacterium]
MPSQLALIICVFFVIVLLIIENRQGTGTTKALWLPTIWFMATASKPLCYWLGIPGDESGSPADRFFLSTIFALGFLVILGRKRGLSSIINKNKLVAILLIYMLLSTLWSDIPFTSLKRWVREAGAVVMVLLVATEPSPREAIERLFRRWIYVLVPFSVLLIKYYPALGRAYGRWSGKVMWIGVTTQKNGLGRLCVIGVFFLIWALIRKDNNASAKKYLKYTDMLILIMALWLLKGPPGSFSATAVVSLAVGIAIFIGLRGLKNLGVCVSPKVTAVILCFVIMFGVTTFMTEGFKLRDFATSLGRDATLTGRTVVWSELIPVAMQRPFLGHGFGGFWTGYTRKMFDISEGHNGYLDLILDLGLVGLLLFSLFLLSSGLRATKLMATDWEWGSFWICLLIMTFVHSITESSLNSFTSPMMAAILFSHISLRSLDAIEAEDSE